MYINKRIAILRKEKGVTQDEFARAIGVSGQSVSKWEASRCCPDIGLLPVIADYFGITIDDLMRHPSAKPSFDSVRLERYLQSKDERYYVPDFYPEMTKMVIWDPFPRREDIEAKRPTSALKSWDGLPVFDPIRTMSDTAGVGVLYISCVPLVPTDKDTWELVGELEAIRLEPTPTSPFLVSEFQKRLTQIILNDRVRYIVFKTELVKRYYEHFLATASADILRILNQRIARSTLKLLPFPSKSLTRIHRDMKEYEDFRAAFDEAAL